MQSTKAPRRRDCRLAAWTACAALVATATPTLSGGCHVSATEHLARLRALVPNETARVQDVRIGSQFRTLSRAGGITLPTEVEVLRPDGSRRTVTVAGDSPESAPIAPIDFPSMDAMLGGQWDRFLDGALAAADARGCAELIVDIRANGGGEVGLGDALLARITDRPYRLCSRMVWRRSPESDELIRMTTKPAARWLLPIGLRFALPEYMGLECGEELTVDTEPASRASVDPGFRGPTCLLIGEPTGGVPNELAEFGPIPLPNSRIPISISQKLDIRASGDESDLGPVRPHIEVAPVADRDAALERAVTEIRRMAAERKE